MQLDIKFGPSNETTQLLPWCVKRTLEQRPATMIYISPTLQCGLKLALGSSIGVLINTLSVSEYRVILPFYIDVSYRTSPFLRSSMHGTRNLQRGLREINGVDENIAESF